MKNLNLCILTYNEEARISKCLRMHSAWADNIIVIDKSSTDMTASICKELGAIVKTIPFSPQGSELMSELVPLAGKDWYVGFTPSDVPSMELMRYLKALIQDIDDSVSCITLPTLYYSFGTHTKNGDWSVCNAPKMFNPRIFVCSDECHQVAHQNNTFYHVPYSSNHWVKHFTHNDPQLFINSHSSYSQVLVDQQPAAAILQQASKSLSFARPARLRNLFNRNRGYLCQLYAWRIYWNMIKLRATYALMNTEDLEKVCTRDDAIKEEWGI